MQEITSKIISLSEYYTPKIVMPFLILVAGFIIIKIINKMLKKFFDKAEFDRTMEIFIERTIEVVLWIILALILLSNLGVDVSALIAGLGIMGFIVGFALKDTLGNLAAGVFILFYKPFKVGDWIMIDNIVGGVEEIGIAACVLNSPDNTKITIPNSKIWGGAIQNFTGNKTRKLFNLHISISYSDDIGKALKVINKILSKEQRILKDPKPQVVVEELWDSGIKIAVRPAVKTEDYWNVYFDLNKKIKEEFDKNKITIPFPQTDVHLKKK